jgi:hypothetical protein
METAPCSSTQLSSRKISFQNRYTLTTTVIIALLYSNDQFIPVFSDWRDVPLLSALSLGVSSVEADVWLVDEELLVCSQFNSHGFVEF